jgi:predicted amidohydrolase YtcJ
MEAADLIVLNARIETLDRQRPQAEALAVRGGSTPAASASSLGSSTATST